MGVFCAKSRRTVLGTGCCFLFLLMPVPAWASSSEPVAGNETLVRYFVNLAVSSQSFVADGWGNRMRIGDESSIEKVAKGLMAQFLTNVSSQVAEIRKSLVEVHEMRASWGRGVSNDVQAARNIEDGWRDSLERLARQSSRLRKELSFPLAAFKSKIDDEMTAPEPVSTGAYEERLTELRKTFNEVVDRINVSFFAPEQTVNVRQLTDENVLQLLHRLELLARTLSKTKLPSGGTERG